MITVELSKKVMSEGAEIEKLEIREPIGEDIVACGYPFRLYIGNDTDADTAGQQEAKVDAVVLASLASRLANVPKSTIKKLCVCDFQAVVEAVSGFFE